jgi:hypothetical protein
MPTSADEVGNAGGLAAAIQLHSRKPDAHFVHHPRANRLHEGGGEILEPVVVIRAEARQILWREAALAADRVAAEQK